MVMKVSEQHIREIVSDEVMAKLDEFVNGLGYYELHALQIAGQKRVNRIAFENADKFAVGQTLGAFSIKDGKVYTGILVEIDAATALMENKTGTRKFTVPTEMLYEVREDRTDLPKYKCANCDHVGVLEDDVKEGEPDFWGNRKVGYTCTRCDYVHYPSEGEMMEKVSG